MSDAFIGKYGPWALVAGASEGLGAEFATQLARRGLNLLLVARRAEVLAVLADKLRADYKVEVKTAALDLAAPDLHARAVAAADGLDVGLVVYNAAASSIGYFLDRPLDEALRIVDVNCRGPVILAHEFGGRMVARGRGGILLMSSLAASQGSPIVSTYAASKAFDLVLAEGLWDELRGRGVDVLACRAGATLTPNYIDSKPAGRVPTMEPAPVVAEALAALGRKPSMVPGWINAFSVFFLSRLLPRRAAIQIMGATSRKLYVR